MAASVHTPSAAGLSGWYDERDYFVSWVVSKRLGMCLMNFYQTATKTDPVTVFKTNKQKQKQAKLP